MSIQINFHMNKDDKLVARSQSFDKEKSSEPFATFEVNSGGQSVTVFLRTVDDAAKLVDAAVEAYRNVEAIELEKRIDSVMSDMPVFGGNTVTDESYNDWLATGENDPGNWT